MLKLTLKDTEARGRNGWFRAREANLETIKEYVCLDVVSKRPVLPGPVRLELSLRDAESLGRLLLATVRAKRRLVKP